MKVSFNIQEEMAKCKTMEDIAGKNGLLKRMLKEMTEQMLEGELTGHLGYEKHSPAGHNSGNSRNGHTGKTVHTGFGEVSLETPRDRRGSFEPQLVKKGQTDITDFDEKIISMYAKGMTTRDIQEHVKDFYGVDISPTFVSNVTDKVLDLAAQWQARPLETVYAIVFLDAVYYKVRQEGRIVSKAAYTCLGIDTKGHKDILGIWIGEKEGAHYWLGVLNELKNRGVEDILIVCVDGLKGFPEAIAQVFPNAETQLCVVHLIRNSLKYVGSKYQKEFMTDLKLVYKAPSLENAEHNLGKLAEKWGAKYPLAIRPWKEHWINASTYFKYSKDIRKIVYTTNAVEAVHRQLRKVTKNRSMFPTDDALTKMLFLAIQGVIRKWTSPVQNWASTISELSMTFAGRVRLERQ
ncbi:MAG: IS256 family transposase [Elusimicrobiota bacterium]